MPSSDTGFCREVKWQMTVLEVNELLVKDRDGKYRLIIERLPKGVRPLISKLVEKLKNY